MLFKSPIFSQASGSIAGITFSHNRGGKYIRERVTPTDPSTPLQVAVRNAMAALTVRWNETLTALQRTAWETYASNVEMTNRIGDTVFLTGQQQYLRSNIPRHQIEVSLVDDAPTVFDLGAFTIPTYGATAPLALAVIFDDSDAWANEDDSYLIAYSSLQQSPTINYFAGPYRFTGSIDGNATTPPTSPAIMSSPTPLTAGNRVFMRARISREDGRLSSPINLGPEVIG